MVKGNKVIVILGSTSSGKTRVGIKLAKKFCGEIVSADSRQVYKGMDVGTGKDLDEYVIKSKVKKSNNKNQITNIKYYLIDVVSPKTDFNVAKYQELAYRAINDILKRGKTPIIVGGTGLYINAVTEGYKFPISNFQFSIIKIRKKLSRLSLGELLKRLKKVDRATYKIIDKQNRRRVQRALEIYYTTGEKKSESSVANKPPYKFLKIGLKVDREVLENRIKERLIRRLEKEGMIGEVKKLKKGGLSWKRLNDFGLEYRYVSRYLKGEMSYGEMVERLNIEIRKFSKRQMTWFKRDKKIKWFSDYQKIEKTVKKFLLCH